MQFYVLAMLTGFAFQLVAGVPVPDPMAIDIKNTSPGVFPRSVQVVSRRADTSAVETDGRGGYNKRDDFAETDGRGGYNKRDNFVETDGRGGYNKRGNFVETDGRGGYNKRGGTVEPDGRGGYN